VTVGGTQKYKKQKYRAQRLGERPECPIFMMSVGDAVLGNKRNDIQGN
jgi:hypothetical protein